MIFVPPPFAGDAILEAADAGVALICCITEGVPVRTASATVIDEIKQRGPLDRQRAIITLIGPNCPGVITPGPKTGGGEIGRRPVHERGCKIGIMPGYIHTHRERRDDGQGGRHRQPSGTLTYEAVWQTSQLAASAQSTCVGIGGDPVKGLNTSTARHVQGRPGDDGDPDDRRDRRDRRGASGRLHQAAGGQAGRGVHRRPHRPPGKRMGHAGAIIGRRGTRARPTTRSPRCARPASASPRARPTWARPWPMPWGCDHRCVRPICIHEKRAPCVLFNHFPTVPPRAFRAGPCRC
jgi:succinyl-CoA synthetase alpha subunit